MRFTVVVITRDRRQSLLAVLAQVRKLTEDAPVIVVDNASRDGTADAVAAEFPDVAVIRSPGNLGAVGRNLAVDHVRTPYVAFCDDDTWWDPDAPSRAAGLLDAHPRLAVVTGRILVEPGGREDPIVPELRDSPVPGPAWLPGPALGSFLAGASMVRTEAFRAAGGFSPRLWLGGEEELLSADLMALGWHLCYAEDVVVHHEPSRLRDPHARRRHGIRNTLWFTWLRRPLPVAGRHHDRHIGRHVGHGLLLSSRSGGPWTPAGTSPGRAAAPRRPAAACAARGPPSRARQRPRRARPGDRLLYTSPSPRDGLRAR
ncbi:glycosyltransferase family 2 protein [Actinomadura sp. BRA 177]|uniref:glycosyltransferase family 2 protein n=1 Tax=Actinomadura sp. BRA 177 TaxID=2745202 RepID=UPI0015961D5C|nr:glycosyltransferase [Actinomadura sp. BRA 177]NVI90772.1 glycosyltransferase [Actinomadura sp. BRA 177]